MAISTNEKVFGRIPGKKSDIKRTVLLSLFVIFFMFAWMSKFDPRVMQEIKISIFLLVAVYVPFKVLTFMMKSNKTDDMNWTLRIGEEYVQQFDDADPDRNDEETEKIFFKDVKKMEVSFDKFTKQVASVTLYVKRTEFCIYDFERMDEILKEIKMRIGDKPIKESVDDLQFTVNVIVPIIIVVFFVLLFCYGLAKDGFFGGKMQDLMPQSRSEFRRSMDKLLEEHK